MNVSRSINATANPVPRAPLFRRPDLLPTPDPAELSGRTPCFSAGVFCESPAAETMLRAALGDRRLSRVTSRISCGGIEAAIAFCSSSPTPDVLIVETTADGDEILSGLDSLSAVCDVNTKVIVIGYRNDIGLYRAMIAKGVSDYLVGPVDSLFAIAAILKLYQDETAVRWGRVCAFLGAKGGVGTSTLAQNVAWRIGQDRSGPVMLADLDLQFGTAALNLNLVPSAGFSEQAMDIDRLDEALLERTLIQKGKYLHVLPASGRLQEIEPPDPVAVEKLLDLCRQAFPIVVLDLPHLQSPWMKAVLSAVDDLVIVAAPDLANLRNAKCLLDIFRASRPNDAPPRVVLNQVGIAKRSGISPADFARGLEIEIETQIGFDPYVFAKAASEGQLLAEVTPKCSAGKAIAALSKDIGTLPASGDPGAPLKRHRFRMHWSLGG